MIFHSGERGREEKDTEGENPENKWMEQERLGKLETGNTWVVGIWMAGAAARNPTCCLGIRRDT